ncbi:MAG TPA: hypothetical protein PLX08_06650 [Bacteroidales bacterium]|nr:hypothetical protein [Bacteroidales bacterium]
MEDNFYFKRMVNRTHILKIGVFSFLLFSTFLQAQEPVVSSRDISAGNTFNNSEKTHSLYAGAGYGSNFIYLGSTISGDRPYGYASVSYGFKNECYISLSGVHLSGMDPFASFYTGSLTYSRAINNWFDISAGLYRYQVVPSLTDTLFNSFTYSDLTLGFDWRLLYTKISGGGLFSDDNQAYFQIRNSHYFQTPELFRGKASFSFDPFINFLFGTVTTVKTNGESQYYYSVLSHSRNWRKKGQGQGQQTTYSDKFGLVEIDLGIPVSFNTDILTIEAEPSYMITLYNDSFYPATGGFVFLISLYFRVF